MSQRRRRKPLMTPEERVDYERSLAETTRMIQELRARLHRQILEDRARQERRERSLLGRLGRRLGLAE